MTKAEKQKYMSKKPVGTLSLTQSTGIAVIAVENGDKDYVVTAFVNEKGEYEQLGKSKIDYSVAGVPSFKKRGRTYKLSDFMKVGDRL